MKRIIAMLFFVVLAGALVVAFLDRAPPVAGSTYEEALQRTGPDRIPWVAAGSDAEAEALARFSELWRDVTVARVQELLPKVYAADLWFNDTVKTLTNRAEFMEYMVATAGHVTSCRVDIRDVARSDDGYYVRWEMRIVPKRPKPGEEWVSIGVTHLRINHEGLVVLHQDYWDAADGLYRHFPLVGWLIRNIRARL